MTKNGKSYLTTHLALCAAAFLLLPMPAPCGNLELVEKSVEELNAVNQDALSQIKDLPRNGQVDLKAYVTVEGSGSKISIQEKRITIGGGSGEARKQAAPPVPGVAVSAPASAGKIEYLEKNSPPSKK